jgi:hypothetical protein|tara:strand:- start:267 stop:605 length:339 start_codon:yes stop_codon:yes gene_type:complete
MTLPEFNQSILTTIEHDDLPYDVVGLSGPTDLTDSNWRGICPGADCKKESRAPVKFLGNTVTCKCGATFMFPAWNLYEADVADSTTGLSALSNSDRPPTGDDEADLFGILLN